MTPNLSAAAEVPPAASGVPPADAGKAAHANPAAQPEQPRQPGKLRSRRKSPAPKPPAPRGSVPRKPAPRGSVRHQAPSARQAAVDARQIPERRVRIGSPTALLAVVPVLLGFQPGNSLVVVGTEPPRDEVRLTLRYDLPDPARADHAAEIARHAAAVLSAQRITTAVAVGYGPGHLVSPVVDALREQAPQAGIAVTELLRAEGQRYWSYVCANPGCCPPEGTPFDITDHPAARAMVPAGSRVLASRDELAATLAAADGVAGEVMQRATRKAEERAARLLARVARSGRKASARRLIATVGLQTVADAIRRYRNGGRIPPDKAAWLTVVLRDLRVRDDAWSRMQPEHMEAHLRLWTDLTRLARSGYVPAPASLLAFVAWQSGNGALANLALDRALADDPLYSMARLLRQAIDSGAPPSLARLPMTPEEVAASYDALERDEDDEDDEDPPVGGPACDAGPHDG